MNLSGMKQRISLSDNVNSMAFFNIFYVHNLESSGTDLEAMSFFSCEHIRLQADKSVVFSVLESFGISCADISMNKGCKKSS